MTGHGAAAGPTELGELRVELRSVNARGFVLKQRVCAEAAAFEGAFEDAVRRHVARGTVMLVVDRTGARGLPDREALRELVTQLRALARDLGLQDDLSLRDVLALAGTGRVEVAGRDAPPGVLELLGRALDDLVQRRRTEGGAIVGEMQGTLREFARALGTVQLRAPELVAVHRERLLQRVGEALKAHGLHLEPADVVREVALFADRSDVSEELHRIEMHLGEVEATLRQGGEVGRRLEFLLQELLRETNTLGSKSPDVAIAHDVVVMKSCIDKLKEQAANLE